MKKFVLTASALALVVAIPLTAPANLPVIDGSNLGQNIVSALNSVRHTLQQAQQLSQLAQMYQTQLRQYLLQIQQASGLAQAAQVWSEARGTMQQLQGVYQTYQQLTGQGGLEQYLSQFRDVNYYMNASPSQYQYSTVGSLTQKQANDGFVRGVMLQEDALKQDAATVDRMQASAVGVQGEMQALQAANQFADMQNKQLMQIRAILLQQQQALAAQMQTQADEKARQDAATQKYLNFHIPPTQKISY
jgi:type IV secretion system protein TrbJ